MGDDVFAAGSTFDGRPPTAGVPDVGGRMSNVAVAAGGRGRGGVYFQVQVAMECAGRSSGAIRPRKRSCGRRARSVRLRRTAA